MAAIFFLKSCGTRPSTRVALLLTIALALVPSLANAVFLVGPIASGTGGAGIAAIDPSESALLNPASLAELQKYYAGAHFGLGTLDNESKVHQYGVLLSDGTPSNIFAGALSYNRKILEDKSGNETKYQDIQLAIGGFPIAHLAFGIAGHRLMSSSQEGEFDQDNLHLGLLYGFTPNFGVGLVGYDVLPVSDSVPVSMQIVPAWGLGTNIVLSQFFHFRFDILRQDRFNDEKKLDYAAGMETLFQNGWIFRLGGHWFGVTGKTNITAGLGFKGPRLSFDYSFQKEVQSDKGIMHLIDLWLPF